MADLQEILGYYAEIKGVHPACEEVPRMSDDELSELKLDLRENGLANPIALTNEGLLLDGRHRLVACYETMQEARFEYTNVDPWSYVCSLNIRRRHLTIGQMAMFAQSMLKHEQALAKERQREAGRHHGRGQEKVQATLPEPISASPQARDKVASQVGVGQKAIDKAKVIAEYAPDLAAQVKKGKLDLEPAYREARKTQKQQESHPIPKFVLTMTPDKQMARVVTINGDVKEIPKPATFKFNETTDSIGWAKWSWNPLTGCLHGCKFCYARGIATSERTDHAFPFGFEPAFHEYRLEEPRKTKVPVSDDPSDGRVFVCSMADLFGKWVPDEWIRRVFDACLKAPEWEYLFLTKWPNRYAQMPLLPRAWYGSSIIQQSDVARVEKAMKGFEGEDIVKWISLEPMLEPIRFGDLSWCDLVVIGSQTATNQPDGFQPAIPAKFDDVWDVVRQCKEADVPYYLKANLGLDRPGMVLPKMSPKSRQ